MDREFIEKLIGETEDIINNYKDDIEYMDSNLATSNLKGYDDLCKKRLHNYEALLLLLKAELDK